MASVPENASSVQKPPRVSLHMTVYNTQRYVAEAVRSILNQTYRDFDLVLWDDGSTDRSLEILHKLAATDSRVRVCGGEHIGVAPAHARAIAAGQGQYIGWIDSDDLLAPTALAQTVAVLDEHAQIGMVYTDHYDMNESGKSIRANPRYNIPYSKDRLLVDFMTFHFRLIRRSAFDAAGGMDATTPCAAEDYDLCLRLSECTEIRHIAKPLYYYRVRQSSFSHQHRYAQIEASAAAVQRALVRRGLTGKLQLFVELNSRFRLVHKSPPAGPRIVTRRPRA